MTIHFYLPVGILLSMHVQHAYAYETSFALKHFNFYEKQITIVREPAQEIPRQQVQKLIQYLIDSGTKTVGAETSEKVVGNYLKAMSIPMGPNHDISKWTLTQCVQAIKRLEEDFKGKQMIAKGLGLTQDMSFKKGLESTIKSARIGWAQNAKFKSPHERSFVAPTNLDESQTEKHVPFWKEIPEAKSFSFNVKDFDMEQFGKSKNVSMSQVFAAHPGVKMGQDVIYADPNIVVTRDSSGKILTVWGNDSPSMMFTRFVADEPQEFVGITKALLKASPYVEAKYETVFVTLTPTRIHTYILSANRAMNVKSELLPEMIKDVNFGKIESFTQSKEHPMLYIVKSHRFFQRTFYTLDLMTMTLIQHNNESDLPN